MNRLQGEAARSSASASNAQFTAEQDKWCREEDDANATGLRVLSAISNPVPVRLMKRDLLFVAFPRCAYARRSMAERERDFRAR